ncbi:ROK family protein [Labrys okinawensis]|uniref:ROK family protein n=1 Tax=Labrys okinawensis TaxID=346911 RepID=UPI0039BC5C38
MHPPYPAIGIDIGGTNVRAACVSASGQILDYVTERTSREAPALLARLVAMVRQLDRPGVSTVGIGVPGRVDARRGLVLSGGYVDLSAVSLADIIGRETGKRALIDNDCNMALTAEVAIGAARGCRHVAMLTIGTGIGGAVLLEGTVLRGRHSAGQLGHVTVEAGGLACNCGRRGCVETVSSGTALGRHIVEAGLPPDVTADGLLALARSGEARAIDVVQAWAAPLRAAIDSIVAAVDPELFLLGGGLGQAACAALEWAPAVSPWYQCPVRPATLGDDAGVIGAALAGAQRDMLVS